MCVRSLFWLFIYRFHKNGEQKNTGYGSIDECLGAASEPEEPMQSSDEKKSHSKAFLLNLSTFVVFGECHKDDSKNILLLMTNEIVNLFLIYTFILL